MVDLWEYQSLTNETELSKLVKVTCQERGDRSPCLVNTTHFVKKSCHQEIIFILTLPLSVYPPWLKKAQINQPERNQEHATHPWHCILLLQNLTHFLLLLSSLFSFNPPSAPHFHNPHLCNINNIQRPFHTTQNTAVIVIFPLKTLCSYNPLLWLFNCFSLAVY